MHRRDALKHVLRLMGCSAAAAVLNVRTALAAPPYPQPSGVAGAPFADPNLKLVVLSALLSANKIDLGTLDEFVSYIFGYEVDPYDVGSELIPAAYAYLIRYPLSQDLLNEVENIEFDGGLLIYPHAWPMWDGETDEFDVATLIGLEYCRNLRSIYATAMIANIDLGIVAQCPDIEDIMAVAPVSNAEALLSMKQLRRVRFSDDELFAEVTTPFHPTRAVFEELKERGVSVFVDYRGWRQLTPRPPPYR